MKDIADRYKIVVRWSEDDQEYVATCPAFPFSVGGTTPDTAVREARELLEEMIHTYESNGDPLPQPDYEMA